VALPYPLHVLHRARVEIPPGRDADVAQGRAPSVGLGCTPRCKPAWRRSGKGPWS